MRRFETKLVRHLILQRLNICRKEFDHFAAFGADHMIVMIVIVMMLIVGFVVAKANLAGESCFGQKLERPIDGRVPDGRIFLDDEAVKVFAGQVVFGAEKYLEDQVALPCATQS